MPLLPSHTLVITHSFLLFGTSVILLINPSLLASSTPVWLMGEAMHIRESPSFSLPSEPLAGLALVLAVLGLVEGVFAGGLATGNTTLRSARRQDGLGGEDDGGNGSVQAFAEKAAIFHDMQGRWMIISTLKTLVFGLLVMYSYLTSGEQEMGYIVPVERNTGLLGLGMLNNRAIFVALFSEMLFWGYIWTVLKEELRELATRIKKIKEELRESDR